MQSPSSTSLLLSELYRAAAEPEHWPHFLSLLNRATGATCGFVIAVDEQISPALYSDIGFDSDFQHAYQGLFRAADITLSRFLEAGEKQGGWIGIRQSLIPDAELERSFFYNEFMKPREIYHQAGINLGRTGKHSHAGISLLRPKSCGQFDEEDVIVLRLLSTHLSQAFLLNQRLTELENQKEIFWNGLDPSSSALITVRENGIISHQTPLAAKLLAKRDGLLVRNGKLQAETQKEQDVLQRLIEGATQVVTGSFGPRSAGPPGGAVLISRRPPRQPLQVIVTPFHPESKLFGSHPSAIVFVTDPESKPLPRGLILRQLYNLTPAEASLADKLLEGLDVKESAERMRITENSARTLLKCVFRKTGLSSQSALMRMALKLPGSPSPSVS